jgi:hypothetical protein
MLPKWAQFTNEDNKAGSHMFLTDGQHCLQIAYSTFMAQNKFTAFFLTLYSLAPCVQAPCHTRRECLRVTLLAALMSALAPLTSLRIGATITERSVTDVLSRVAQLTSPPLDSSSNTAFSILAKSLSSVPFLCAAMLL